MKEDIDGGNLYNKYESKNPLVKFLMKMYLNDFDSLIYPIKNEIESTFEIGCGEGYLTKHIRDMGIPIEGADVSERVVEHAREIHPSINFTVKSIYEVSNYNKKHDLILASEVLEHLEKPEHAIDELKEATTKYIFLSVPNEPFFRMANVLRLKYLNDLGNTPGHINHWSYKSFKKFIENNSLKIVSSKISTLWLMALCEVEE
ncbi:MULTISPECIES: class I SAM-dependent methyltransferase [Methanohalophilus]|uniref:Class I SAM-dependent methyltransferase n=1 Tax=Methanohalophilus euhalobius TaxID=51203 RepID=A0A314ZTD5_9EURY|nr:MULTISPECIES: class I SAM-dependent methyltransferase [Methanohalophilus]OBZ34283.1 MAG: hypothetical protein A9957_04120 [Methanohalophilus sp. DAL1]PQV43135.1 methyltransferase family protein [Methanohalophilus euhalobius]RNI09302.1 class I SAM-dependent methyltransferase [Methanohalophilus euhalobius]